MKKTILGAFLATLATVILCVCLTACSTNIVGDYKFYSMKGNEAGIEISYKVGDDILGVGKITEDFMTLSIKEDNTFTITAMGSETKGTWKEDGGKYILTIAGQDQEVSVSGGKLTRKQGDNQVTFKK